MAPADSPADLEALVARLAATEREDERRQILAMVQGPPEAVRRVAERLKEEADRALYQDAQLSLRWSRDIITLGTLAAVPTAIALGQVAEAFIYYWQGQHRDSLRLYDEASALFRDHGDAVGWARAQIGRTVPCMALARFDEALERAEEARPILEQAGETLRVASLDTNLALLLERMNRPAEALAYSERALAAYRHSDATGYALHTLGNHALLLWRNGRVREALAAHQEARQGYVALGATADAVREDLNMGAAYLALGRYAEASSSLLGARRDMQRLGSPYPAAVAGLYLVQCYVSVGRFRHALELTPALIEEFVGCEEAVGEGQCLVLQALAQAGLRAHSAALDSLDRAASLLSRCDGFEVHRASLDVSRAQLLLERGSAAEACALLEHTVPALQHAGLRIEAAAARLAWGQALLDGDRSAEIQSAVSDVLALATEERLDGLAAMAWHLRGRAQVRAGDQQGAQGALATAVRYLDRVKRRVAWDDRATFGDRTGGICADAMDLALRLEQPALALFYAERAKAGALADHLRGRIDVRPRARDERSQALVGELEELRERQAWLTAPNSVASGEHEGLAAAVRWAATPAVPAQAREEVERIERRIMEIWRELQARHPAYRGEAAALDLAGVEDDAAPDDTSDEIALNWVSRVYTAIGSDDTVALLEYAEAGDDLVVYVLRAGEVHARRLDGAMARVQRLVHLLRLNVERCALSVAEAGRVPRALAGNARGLLSQLHAVLLAPILPLLDGCARLVIVPHGSGHHVPFHALFDGRRYLVETMEVSYVPCAGLIEHFEGSQRLLSTMRTGTGHEALVLTCSNSGVLSQVEAEGRAVGAALGGRMLHEQRATLGALRAHAGDCNVLHIAAHARFRPDEPLFSSLTLSDGQLTALDVFDLELTCSLATLSACETALGHVGAGDELMGLSRAFLYAGAPSLLLTLWKVEDRSTAALMEAFYGALCRGAGKAAALRQAQLSLLHNDLAGGGDWSAPFFWAPFTLIGHAGPLSNVQ
jgi:tetratricopeptide (TPR) repeat protein